MNIKSLAYLFLFFFWFVSTVAYADESSWSRIDVPNQPQQITLPNNRQITINPSCAFETIDGVPNPFYFLYKPGTGESNKLLVYFNGGGACWNDATCVKSLVSGDRPTYNPTSLQANSPQGAGGIFDAENAENPFKDWSMVYIPYCTGDVHIGSKTVIYSDVDGSLTGFPGAPIPVNHHGYDNTMAVVNWLNNNISKSRLRKLVVAGSSAGGYGATLNFPRIQNVFPHTPAMLISDASMAVVSQGFLDSVFVPGGNWNLEKTLSREVFKNKLGKYSADKFNEDLLTKLAFAYPKARFSQDTKSLDVVQVQFLKIMRTVDSGNQDPMAWALNPAADAPLFSEWNARMEDSVAEIAERTDNYQYYVSPGLIHMLLVNEFATPDEPNPFYDDFVGGVYFKDWINRFVNAHKFREHSVK